jgi:uncharacterized phage-associated protein
MTIKNSDKKAIQALNFFASKSGGKINRMKAIKLIWLSDRAHLRRFGRPILSDKYYAIKLGPIPSKTKNFSEADGLMTDEVKTYRDSFIEPLGKYDVKSLAAPDINVFSQTDIETMEKIFAIFGHYDKYRLSNLSHKFPEWKKYEDYFKVNDTGRKRMSYDDFFKDTPESAEYFNEPEELLSLAKEVFEEGCSIS